MSRYDVIVLGIGAVGSATAHELSRRGSKVLGLERFSVAHDRGSSHGDTRIIRLAYMEHPDYVPLLRRSYELWAQLEKERGEKLYHECGLLQVGPQGGHVIQGVLASARAHDLAVEALTAEEAEKRFAGIRLTRSMTALYETCAGYLPIERCIEVYAEEAQKLGAELKFGETVTSWDADGEGVIVGTENAEYRADRLVITAGPWAIDFLGSLNIPLRVQRQPLFWFETPTTTYKAENGFPCFLLETPRGMYYGFPSIDDNGIKVARHMDGEVVDDPLHVDRELRPEDEADLVNFLRVHFPQVNFHVTRHSVCMYTLTPDEHFVVDKHPDHPQVSFCTGLSGHGFKLAPSLAEILSDFALTGETSAPVEFLRHDRPALKSS